MYIHIFVYIYIYAYIYISIIQMQAHLREVPCSVPYYYNKANATIKQVNPKSFVSQYIKKLCLFTVVY